MTYYIDRKALSTVEGWIGTPWAFRESCKGVGCDCLGLVRGVYAEIEEIDAPEVPPLRNDWAADQGRALVTALAHYLTPIPVAKAGPGCVVAVRIGAGRVVHCGILAEDNTFIHAIERYGVVRVPAREFLKAAKIAAHFSSAQEEMV